MTDDLKLNSNNIDWTALPYIYKWFFKDENDIYWQECWKPVIILLKKKNNLRNEMDELCVVVDLNNLFGIKNYRNETDERAQ